MTVVPHRPWQRAVSCLLALLILVVSLLFAYQTGFDRGASNLAEINLAHSQGVSDVQRAAAQVAELQASLAVAERTRQVDEQVNAQAQASIAELRNQIALLERDVALYRQVMALEAETPTLTLQSWQLLRTQSPDHYRYRLALSHAGANGDVLTGTLHIAVAGAMAPGVEAKTLDATEPVAVRYLQVLEGDLWLPSGFMAEHVRLEFSAGAPSTVQFSDSMPWQPQGEI